jgi:aldose 1-epimerase
MPVTNFLSDKKEPLKLNSKLINMNILKEDDFIGQINGRATALYTLRNKNGLVVQITNFGAKIVSMYVPDRNGVFADIILGYDSIQGYISGHPYHGAICGRYANRIANATYSIDGIKYDFPANNGPNHLHGGIDGFNNQMFDAKEVVDGDNNQSIELMYVSADGEMGHPGTVILIVNYMLTDNNEFVIEYKATTDEPTHINICSHGYYNLAGEGNGNILNHELMINADYFTPTNNVSIPSGEFMKVEGTPMDFTKFKVIGSRIHESYEQLEFGHGYDHNWVINKKEQELALAATCVEPISGRYMEVYTSQPGVQFYSANWMDGTDKGKGGKLYPQYGGLCLETQHFPDSPNKPMFPTTLLIPGEVYLHTCMHRFSIK